LVLTSGLRETYPGTPNALFFCAIILSGRYGGFGPGRFSRCVDGVVEEGLAGGVVSHYSIDHVRIPY
jgi:hypothetical protein